MRTGASAGSIKLQSGGDSFSSLYFPLRAHRQDAQHARARCRSRERGRLVGVGHNGTGNYFGDPPLSPTPEDVYSLFLSKNGTYYAVNTDASTETGVWTARRAVHSRLGYSLLGCEHQGCARPSDT